MDASSLRSCGNICQIEDKVSDLSAENIHRGPIQILGVVNVAVDQTKALEISGGFQDWQIIGIADQLRIVLINN